MTYIQPHLIQTHASLVHATPSRGRMPTPTQPSEEWKVTGTNRSIRPDDESVWMERVGQWQRKWLPGEKEAEAQRRVGDVKVSQEQELFDYKHNLEKDIIEQRHNLGINEIAQKLNMTTPSGAPAVQTTFPGDPASAVDALKNQIFGVLSTSRANGAGEQSGVSITPAWSGAPDIGQIADALSAQPEEDLASIYANGGSIFGAGGGAPDMDAAAGGSEAFEDNYSFGLGELTKMFFPQD